jgi:hypothetical protein
MLLTITCKTKQKQQKKYISIFKRNNNNRKVYIAPMTPVKEIRVRDEWPSLRSKVLHAKFRRSPSHWVAYIRHLKASTGVQLELTRLVKETMTWVKSHKSIDSFLASMGQTGRSREASTQTDESVFSPFLVPSFQPKWTTANRGDTFGYQQPGYQTITGEYRQVVTSSNSLPTVEDLISCDLSDFC